MKLNILKTEVAFQILLSLGSFLYLVIDHNKQNQASDFFIALFFIGVANLLGFLIRISVVASKLHRYYFFGVILFFLLLFGISSLTIDSKVDFVMNFMGIGGILFNIYYLVYGFYLIRNHSKK
ncbi:hypothetical protein AB670_01159 [Chryseobacterium sp. MOF25P]|uniref:hypothetical protein n=1 Tax=unclassified Chryseobacterium TaxID=2593645 RepID=UPI000805A4F9|nr:MULTISPECIES: hypothetical protein [unclassified Chryseobacterium]OBW42458.1 hypothetical protein AB670_01159 [Chryseobacterium sp. MOF25P]OBW47390.1 hypothetical protein AB671_00460 [Chryseobacterium sp. BGARF1]